MRAYARDCRNCDERCPRFMSQLLCCVVRTPHARAGHSSAHAAISTPPSAHKAPSHASARCQTEAQRQHRYPGIRPLAHRKAAACPFARPQCDPATEQRAVEHRAQHGRIRAHAAHCAAARLNSAAHARRVHHDSAIRAHRSHTRPVAPERGVRRVIGAEVARCRLARGLLPARSAGAAAAEPLAL